MGDQPLPYNMTIFQAIKQYGLVSGRGGIMMCGAWQDHDDVWVGGRIRMCGRGGSMIMCGRGRIMMCGMWQDHDKVWWVGVWVWQEHDDVWAWQEHDVWGENQYVWAWQDHDVWAWHQCVDGSITRCGRDHVSLCVCIN